MTWLIPVILVALLTVGVTMFGRSYRSNANLDSQSAYERDKYKFGNMLAKLAPPIGIAMIVVITFFSMFYTVSSREVGVIRTFGAITGTQTSDGPHLKAPWQSVEKYSTATETLELDSQAVSKETQDVTGHLVVNYHVDPTNVEKLARTVGTDWKNLIPSRVQQAFKEQTVQYLTTEIAPNRPKLRADTALALRTDLEARGIAVEDVLIENLSFPPELQAAITAKQVAQQQAEAAKNVTAQRKEEKKQTIAIAEGQARSDQLRSQNLQNSPELLQLRIAEETTKQVAALAASKTAQLIPSNIIFTRPTP